MVTLVIDVSAAITRADCAEREDIPKTGNREAAASWNKLRFFIIRGVLVLAELYIGKDVTPFTETGTLRRLREVSVSIPSSKPEGGTYCFRLLWMARSAPSTNRLAQ